jgi:KEOPS complex subunit Pcc1
VTGPRDHHASLCFQYADQQRACIVAEAVRVEAGEIQRETGTTERSKTSVERTGRTLRIHLAADDLIALRAGLNTWSRLVDVAEQTTQSA